MDPRGINFLSEKNSLLIAPAGYGKTTFLAEALEYLCPIVPTPILVLTHTHAGVASIKKKVRSHKYRFKSRNYNHFRFLSENCIDIRWSSPMCKSRWKTEF